MSVGANQDEAEQSAQQTLVEMLQKRPVEPYPLAYARKAVVNDFIKAKKRDAAELSTAAGQWIRLNDRDTGGRTARASAE